MIRTAAFSERGREAPRWDAIVAKLFDIPEAVVRQMEPLLDDSSCWMLSDRSEIADGHRDLRVIRVPAGSGRRGAEALLARGVPGMVVQRHVHVLDEHTLVLRGAFEEDGQKVIRRGDLLVRRAGSSHTIRVIGDEDCVCAVLLTPPQTGPDWGD